MAKFDFGIFSKAGGSIGGTTFSRARDRQGKVQTARQRVAPSNPQTAAQTAVRDNFRDTLDIVRTVGSEVYQEDFDRSISKLPGYQSMFSVFQRSKEEVDTNIVVNAVQPDTPLGNLDRTSWSSNPTGNDTFQFIWDTALQGNQSADDIPCYGAIVQEFPVASIGGDRVVFYAGGLFGDEVRSNGSAFVDMQGFPGVASGFYGFLYFRPASESPVTSPSPVVWDTVPHS